MELCGAYVDAVVAAWLLTIVSTALFVYVSLLTANVPKLVMSWVIFLLSIKLLTVVVVGSPDA